MGSTFDGVWRGANGELEMRNVTGAEREVTLGTVCMKVLIKPTGQIGSCQAKKPERTQCAQDASRPGGRVVGGRAAGVKPMKSQKSVFHSRGYLPSKLQFLSTVKVVFFLVLS